MYHLSFDVSIPFETRSLSRRIGAADKSSTILNMLLSNPVCTGRTIVNSFTRKAVSVSVRGTTNVDKGGIAAIKVPTELPGRGVEIDEIWSPHSISPLHLIDNQFRITLDMNITDPNRLADEEFKALDQSIVLTNVVSEAFTDVVPTLRDHFVVREFHKNPSASSLTVFTTASAVKSQNQRVVGRAHFGVCFLFVGVETKNGTEKRERDENVE